MIDIVKVINKFKELRRIKLFKIISYEHGFTNPDDPECRFK